MNKRMATPKLNKNGESGQLRQTLMIVSTTSRNIKLW